MSRTQFDAALDAAADELCRRLAIVSSVESLVGSPEPGRPPALALDLGDEIRSIERQRRWAAVYQEAFRTAWEPDDPGHASCGQPSRSARQSAG